MNTVSDLLQTVNTFSLTLSKYELPILSNKIGNCRNKIRHLQEHLTLPNLISLDISTDDILVSDLPISILYSFMDIESLLNKISKEYSIRHNSRLSNEILNLKVSKMNIIEEINLSLGKYLLRCKDLESEEEYISSFYLDNMRRHLHFSLSDSELDALGTLSESKEIDNMKYLLDKCLEKVDKHLIVINRHLNYVK